MAKVLQQRIFIVSVIIFIYGREVCQRFLDLNWLPGYLAGEHWDVSNRKNSKQDHVHHVRTKLYDTLYVSAFHPVRIECPSFGSRPNQTVFFFLFTWHLFIVKPANAEFPAQLKETNRSSPSLYVCRCATRAGFNLALKCVCIHLCLCGSNPRFVCLQAVHINNGNS